VSVKLASSPPFPLPVLHLLRSMSSRRCACHDSFLWSQDELVSSASSSNNDLFCHLTSRVKTEALNLHHRHQPPSLDCSTPTLHFYKKIISTLVIIFITQPCLYFAFSLAKAPRYRSSTRRHCFLSLSSHTYCLFTHGDELANTLSFFKQLINM
jgi:hypothetical protein